MVVPTLADGDQGRQRIADYWQLQRSKPRSRQRSQFERERDHI